MLIYFHLFRKIVPQVVDSNLITRYSFLVSIQIRIFLKLVDVMSMVIYCEKLASHQRFKVQVYALSCFSSFSLCMIE